MFNSKLIQTVLIAMALTLSTSVFSGTTVSTGADVTNTSSNFLVGFTTNSFDEKRFIRHHR